MGKVKNPERRCRICGAKCEKGMRYCKRCAADLRDIRRRVGVYYTPDRGDWRRGAARHGRHRDHEPAAIDWRLPGRAAARIGFISPIGRRAGSAEIPKARGETYTG